VLPDLVVWFDCLDGSGARAVDAHLQFGSMTSVPHHLWLTGSFSHTHFQPFKSSAQNPSSRIDQIVEFPRFLPGFTRQVRRHRHA
jgi:hypothetical protein